MVFFWFLLASTLPATAASAAPPSITHLAKSHARKPSPDPIAGASMAQLRTTTQLRAQRLTMPISSSKKEHHLAAMSLTKVARRADPTEDGYADTDPEHPRETPPEGDPVGDDEGWGPDAADREISPAGEMPEHFSILTLVLGPCKCTGPLQCSKTDLYVGLPVTAAMMVYTFKALKVMSDAYWVPSIFTLTKALGIAPDVAGATLLAFGSSAPEFCTNVVATFFIVNECGVGDIIGSAVHNVLLIVGVSGVFAGKALNIWWFPLTRDCLFFLISIIELLVFLIDEYVAAWEAAIMVATYLVYISFMFFNENILEAVEARFPALACRPEEGDDEDDDDDGSCWPWDPLEILWTYIIPSPKTSAWPCFFVSLSGIAILSYLMVDSATRFGCIVGIPSLFMGLVFLAAGTSIPDAFGSMAAAKKGEGDMAVSNALGSNIFDILMGLALPWLISNLLGKPIVFIGAHRLIYWILLLLVVLVAFVGGVKLNRWVLNKCMGGFLIALYVCYVVWALLKSFSLVP